MNTITTEIIHTHLLNFFVAIHAFAKSALAGHACGLIKIK